MDNLRIGRYRGKWAAVWTGPGGTRRRSLGTEDRELAERRFADFTRALRAPTETLAEIFLAYCADLDARAKPSTRARDAWKALASTFSHLRPDQIDKPLCRAYAKHRRRQGRADGTIGKELGTMATALKWWRKDHPARIELPPRTRPRERYLSRAEYARLRRAAKTSLHVYVFTVLALGTAARKQAILDLTWDRVDFRRRQIRLSDGKGAGKGRATVPMTRHVRRVLVLAHRYARAERVVEYAGRPVGDVKKAFERAAARAGLKDVTPHVLRHTAAVWMAEAGVPMPEIAQYLGHADDRITQRVYARYSPDHLRRAASALE